MDDATFTSDAVSTTRQLMAIRSSMSKENEDEDSRDVIKDLAKKGVTLNREQLTALSTEFLLTVLLDAMLLRLLDKVATVSSDQQQLMDAAAAKKKKKKAAAKKKRYKRNKAAAKQQHKKTKLMSWLSGGIISVIMMIAFSFITTPIVTLSLFQPSDGSGEGNAPPALPPSASKFLRQKDLKWKNEASTSPDIIRSPLAAVVPSPRPIAMSNRHKKFDKMRESTSTASAIDTDHPTSHKRNSNRLNLFPTYFPTNLPTTTSPTITNSPTKSANPSSSPSITANPTQFCLDTPNWEDEYGNGCDVYRDALEYFELDVICSSAAGDMGLVSTNCCICGGGSHSLPAHTNSLKPTSSPSISANPTQTCFDTPGWKDRFGNGCDDYRSWNLYRGCPNTDTDDWAGDMGSVSTHCCICAGGSTTCEDFRSKCQKYINDLNLVFNEIGLFVPVCKEAEYCSCEAADHDVKIDEDGNYTVGLYNECKCDFWLQLCEDTRGGEACDYAAEYCCGDYGYNYIEEGFYFLNSPTCYCDFFNYAQNEFGYKLNSRALNISKEFENPCGQDQNFISFLKRTKLKFEEDGEDVDFLDKFERASLEVIYNATDGQNWTNDTGWLNEKVDHCQWYGITCHDRYVTSIDLRDNNLAGQFPIYKRNTFFGASPESWWGVDTIPASFWIFTKYGLANLFYLKSLDLADNKLTGTIEYAPLYNLYSLTHFDVSGNQLSGRIDTLVTPSLTYADFHNNSFTSMRRFVQYKASPLQTLRFCDLSNNTIQNDAADLLEYIPHNIERFFASNNQIYGSLPESLNSLPELRQCNMSSNALSGTLPGFKDSILSLQELDLSNQTNGFTGSIPEDLWRFQSLKVLNLASNKIAGPIPPDIGKMAALEEFDLSNNNVTGAIPSELGMLAGTLKRIGLANNTLSGTIPSQLGQLQGAYILLKGNLFQINSIAPLSLCLESEVEKFDLATNVTLCPPERNALTDFYDSTKGAEWTDGSLWLDEYESYCDWKGVTCDDSNRVIKLELRNNGLSGKLRESIGDLTSMDVLDLSDNDIKGSIPAAIGLLSNLTYLRLSYNAFTGTAECLEELTKLQLIQLQSNRITGMPNMTQLDDSLYNKSTFITDCGVPSAFDETPDCKDCTMCCNANDDCYPTEETGIAKFGNGKFAAVFFPCFLVFSSMVVLFSYFVGKRNNRGNALTMSAERRLEEDDKYALSRIGKDSVYSYFVTEKPIGWLAAFATLGIQVGILAFFVMASEANLQKDTTDIEFTWKCPRDSDVCKDKADLTNAGWAIFCVLMIAFLAKDIINGCKLIYFSSKANTLGARIRYLIGGTGLFSITLFAFYVSTVYNKAIATSNTEIIVNSVIVLFIMEIDEHIFSALDAFNEKWTEHAAEADKEVSKMKEQIESQQKEIDNQREVLRMLREAVEKIQESQAAEASPGARDTPVCGKRRFALS